MSASLTRSNQSTDHFRRVQEAMTGYGQATPDRPHCPDPQVLVARMRMLLEEVWEQLAACGVSVTIDGDELRFDDMVFEIRPEHDLTFDNIHSLLDGVADVSVVNTGTLVACGFPDKPLLELVDSNNLAKVANGRMNKITGKFEKAPNHVPPNIRGYVQSMLMQYPPLGA